MALSDFRQRAFRALQPQSLRYFNQKNLSALVRGKLWLQVLIGMVLGLGTGIAIGPSAGLIEPERANVIANWLALPGRLFLALVQMIVIPLIIASIVRGIAASESIDQLKTMGSAVVAYFLVTTVIAICIGLWLAYMIEPGQYISGQDLVQTFQASAPATEGALKLSAGALPEQLMSIFPANPIASMVESEMLQVVIFAIIVGAALVLMAPAQSKPLLELFGSVQEVCMTVVRWAMVLAPFAVFGLLAQLTAKIGLDALFGMAVYVGVVLLGLFCLLIIYLTIVFAVRRMNPFAFMGRIRDVFLLAFSTSSSAAVMPLSIETVEDRLGVRPSISQFVIPLGATINMNGTALYQGVATIFLAQVFGVDLGLAELILIVVTAVGASIGSPATPGVGIVILSMVLSSVGIPAAGIALIIGVDRILDMSRTAINVTGDIVACLLMDRFIGGPEPITAVRAKVEEAQAHALATGETVQIREIDETEK